MTKEEFLKGVENWSNHRYLLWEALELTKDLPGPVVEMGMGSGSTPFLAAYCKANNRQLFSYENNMGWYDKCAEFNPDGSFYITDWDIVAEKHLTPSVIFIDNAPGERRHIDVQLFAKRARIVVMHDTELAANHGYKMRDQKQLYQYWKDHESPGAWASMASNFIAF